MLKADPGEFTPSPEIKDADELELFELDMLSKEQFAPHAPSAADIDEFNRALGAQEQAPVKFSSPLLTTLTENDYQELVAALDKLIDVVDEDENHFLAPLMEFIGNLIEKYEEEVGMTASRPPGRGLRAAYNADEPEYTPAQLNLIKSQRQNPTER